MVACEVVQSYNIKHSKIYKEQFILSFELYFMYNATFFNATLNLYKQKKYKFSAHGSPEAAKQGTNEYSTQAINITKSCISMHYLRIHPPIFFLQPTKQKSMNK